MSGVQGWNECVQKRSTEPRNGFTSLAAISYEGAIYGLNSQTMGVTLERLPDAAGVSQMWRR